MLREPGGGGVRREGDLLVFGERGDGDDEVGGVWGERCCDKRHARVLSDGEELVGFGVDEHPAAVEGEAVLVQGSVGKADPPAGFYGVDVEGVDGGGFGVVVAEEEVELVFEGVDGFGGEEEREEEDGEGCEEEDGGGLHCVLLFLLFCAVQCVWLLRIGAFIAV